MTSTVKVLKKEEGQAMKMLRGFVILLSLMFVLGVMKAAQADMTAIYGPVYITKATSEGGKDKDKKKETKLTFTASVPGEGILIIKNGGDAGKKHRVSSAEIKLNGKEIVDEKDFNKNVDTLQYNVQLLSTNELEVEVKSCKECELELTVMGEQALPPRTPLNLPTR